MRKGLADKYAKEADQYRDTLIEYYGEDKGRRIKYAQAFEICEYGRQPSKDDMKQMFPL